MFKMRELRGEGRVVVRHIPGESNPADLSTKILSRQPFEKHQRFVLNTPADDGMEGGTLFRRDARHVPARWEGCTIR